jgi:SAM-dependent methyltransferase
LENEKQYFNYLLARSPLGLWYRRHWLYPRMNRFLHGRVLDIGCGIGDMVRFRPDTAGVDVNGECVRYCVEQGLDVTLMEPDRLPFEGATFDGVVLDNVLEHIAEPSPLLAEVRRVLKPGGKFLVAVPGARGYAHDPDHKVFYTDRGLVERVSRAGFVHETTRHTPFRFPGLQHLLSLHALLGVFRRGP